MKPLVKTPSPDDKKKHEKKSIAWYWWVVGGVAALGTGFVGYKFFKRGGGGKTMKRLMGGGR